MGNLIKVEWLKIKKYRAFWWMLGIVILSYSLINYGFYNAYRDILNGDGNSEEGMAAQILKALANPFTFPEVWHTVAYASSFFIFLPAIVIIMFISNEYTYKTHRQNIIDGLSRNQFMTAKMIDVFLISLIITMLYIIIALAIGFANNEYATGNVWGKANYIFLFFLQVFSQLSLAFLVAFFLKRAFIALGVFLFYLIAEQIFASYVNAKWNNGVEKFFPLEISDKLIVVPPFLGRTFDRENEWYGAALDSINTHVIYTLILLAISWSICYWFNKRKDI